MSWRAGASTALPVCYKAAFPIMRGGCRRRASRARTADAGAPRPEYLESREPVHRLDRHRSVGARLRGGALGGARARTSRLRTGSGVHLGAQARDPYAVADARGTRFAVAAGRAQLAAQ